MQKKNQELEVWLQKVAAMKQRGADLSKEEDLSIALMNLISLEEHLYFTAMKTNKARYLEMLNSVRELRKSVLKSFVKDPKGEEWCISKHLLATSMRLIEVGTKELGNGNGRRARELFSSAFDLYSLFFAINAAPSGVKQMKLALGLDKALLSDEKLEKAEIASAANPGAHFMARLSALVKKIVDCCRE